MIPPVDTSTFQLGLPPGETPEDEPEESLLLEAMWKDVHAYVASRSWASFVSEILLAYAIAPILGLFLVRFHSSPWSEIPDERERWVVVGDLPYMNFETDGFATPESALEFYCVLAEDWADLVLAGEDISEAYPIAAAPTAEHANLLKSRVAFYRKRLIPSCKKQAAQIRRAAKKAAGG